MTSRKISGNFAAVTTVAAAFFHLSCAAPPSTSAIAPVQTRAPSVTHSHNLTFSTGCVRSGLEQCFNAIDDDCNGHVDEQCGAPDGLIQLIIAWDAAPIDVDLDVTDANGELARSGSVTQLGYIKDRDCPISAACGDQNTETVTSVDRIPTRSPLSVAIRVKGMQPDPWQVRVQLGGHLGPWPISAWTFLVNSNDRAEFEISE